MQLYILNILANTGLTAYLLLNGLLLHAPTVLQELLPDPVPRGVSPACTRPGVFVLCAVVWI